MSHVAESVEVAAPVAVAYERWLASPGYPGFLHGVESVQLTGARMRWVTVVNGVEQESEAELTELVPGERIAWRAVRGAEESGVVTFHPLGDGETRVMLQLDHTPHGVLDNLGDWLGFVAHDVQRCLRDFKELLEGGSAQQA
ncbi:SRPBCC family protein [Kitasatospora sp. NPDC096147]|uniref:SRPBCC family protein n=1 Tax=Kitasatospora sp. NPDC096147 TaxID=3364093 RepID=UPI0037F16C20